MPATHTPSASSKEPRVVETVRGTAHPVALRPQGR
jgi:hypothetical protein